MINQVGVLSVIILMTVFGNFCIMACILTHRSNMMARDLTHQNLCLLVKIQQLFLLLEWNSSYQAPMQESKSLKLPQMSN